MRLSDGVRMLYVIRFEYSIVLRNPLQEAQVTFLWPLQLDFTKDHLTVRFVTLEKNIGSYVDGRSYYVDRKSTEEKAVLQALREATAPNLNLEVLDLHRGVKKLWSEGSIDSSRARYKKAYSTSSEAMDEDLLIKEHDPNLYAILMESPLYNTLFRVINLGDSSVSVFSVAPAKGYVAFSRYTNNRGDTDHVVREIIRHN